MLTQAQGTAALVRIEAQHVRLFRLFNEIQQAVDARGDQVTLAALVAELQSEAALHFREEEAFMDGVDYPKVSGHRWEHELLFSDVARLASACSSADYASAAAIADALRTVVHNHTTETDSDFIKYFADRDWQTASAARSAPTDV